MPILYLTPERRRLTCGAVSDVDSDHVVGKHEFADFIFHMAAADLAHGSEPSGDNAPQVMRSIQPDWLYLVL